MTTSMDAIVSLAKRRGFIFPSSEIYGGFAGFWDYGPLGVELKNNIKREWWRMFVDLRSDMYGIDSSIITNPLVWKTSGHVESFVDPMIDCKKCKSRFRADKIDVSKGCPICGEHDFTSARPFQMMFKTYAGPVEDTASETYLRPETAQGMFINFKNIVDSFHPKLSFGIAQIGKAFRNEITPGNFIFRTREFEQMEIEYFVRKENWQENFENWLKEMHKWIDILGISGVHNTELAKNELAHYSSRTVDLEFEYPFGKEELYGLAYRTDFDLNNHTKGSKVLLEYIEDDGTKFFPHVIEPTFGVDRTVLAVLLSSYREEKDREGVRIVLGLKPFLSPLVAAVFPLVSNKPEIVAKADKLFKMVKEDMSWHGRAVAWDDIGNIGKRYRRQDEIGTPWCLTVDYQTLEDGTITIRDRDTMKQERVHEKDLKSFFVEKLNP